MDATRLRLGLTDYLAALRRQQIEMREEGQQLAAVWIHTRDTYQGSGAEEFRDAYERSSQMLADYLGALEALIPILDQRLQSLGRFDSSADLPL